MSYERHSHLHKALLRIGSMGEERVMQICQILDYSGLIPDAMKPKHCLLAANRSQGEELSAILDEMEEQLLVVRKKGQVEALHQYGCDAYDF
jgi:hypothetical protein